MRKNKMMRAASGLLVATLLTTSVIAGTFAKYTTSAEGTDSARVAKWGFNATTSLTLTDLFKDAYNNTSDEETVKSATTNDDVIAPGTTGSATFAFKYGEAEKKPEVKYTFGVSTEGSTCADSIKNNKNIKWKLDNGDYGTWEQLLAALDKLDGQENGVATYKAGNLPAGFGTDSEHTVSWQWVFTGEETYGDDQTQDQYDTAMGNVTAADLAQVTLKITITATQVD